MRPIRTILSIEIVEGGVELDSPILHHLPRLRMKFGVFFLERIFIDRNSPRDTATLISPGLDLPEHGFEPFTVPSCGLRVFYTGTIFCAPPTSTYSGSVRAGH